MDQQILEVSWSTILKVILVIVTALLVYLLRDVLVLAVFSLIISLVFEAPIRLLQKRIPRTLAIIFVYLASFFLVSLSIYFPASEIINEIKRFVGLFPVYFDEVAPLFSRLGFKAFQDIENFVQALEKELGLLTSNILNIVFSIFGGLASTFFIVSMAVFLSLEENTIQKVLILFFPEKEHKFVKLLWRRSQKNVSLWFLTTVIVSFLIGVFTYIALLILRAPYPLSLSIIGGLLNFIPVLGPAVAGGIIFLVLALDSLPKALIAVIIYIVIQQVENNILSPLFTKKTNKLSPVLVLFSLAAGGKLFGIVGAILAVPLIGMIVEFSSGLLEKRRGS